MAYTVLRLPLGYDMKANLPSVHNLADCDNILNLLDDVLKLKRPSRSLDSFEKLIDRCNVGFLVASIVGLLVLVALVPISRVGHVRIPFEVALLVGIYSELTALLSLIAIVIGQAVYLNRVRQNPIAPLFRLTRIDMNLYAPYVAELATYDAVDLKWVKTHLTLQRDAFDRRRYFLPGPIDKIGLLPVVIGALTTIPKIVEQFGAAVPISWMWNAIAVCVCFYLVAWLTHRNGTRMGFAITLLEGAIELKEASDSDKHS
jgi:hypothetical protein